MYLVMDLVTGGDMRVHINEKSKGRKMFSSNDVVYFISHLLVALEFCHNRNVLHRDIKPDNILICESGTLKLTDFGISHKLKSRESFCIMSSGTLEYMAPEILKKGHEHSWPSELYSVGVYMYELLLLSLPNELGNFSKLEDSAKAEKDPKIKGIKEFALKCLEPLPDDRFQTVKDAYANEMFEGADMKDWGKDSYPVKVSFKPDVSHTNVQDNAKQEDLMSAFGGEDDDDKPKIEEKFQTKFKSYGWNNMLKKESSLRSGRSSLIMGLRSIQNSGRISIGKAGNAAAKTAMKYSPETDNVKSDCPNQAPRSYREGRRNSDLGLAAA
ncbi:hypothetical protein TL16_g13185 [Triparma laevis f. inornata]|uniref:non-specific serine/threonine protein kinase n=1 Tax=Triparma laevis f. inornata TaxID=1714386 RepID=A0A9W7BSB2_9STRA|nr:hypothetical protein TL16_g13185 [Triparma laevis f. inornata]